MNYAEPRQVDPKLDKDDAGKWRWTVSNRRIGVWAAGYCAEDCPGHETPLEAAQHYHEYQLGNIRLSSLQDTQHPCEKCGEWTGLIASLPHGDTYTLCEPHRTKEVLAEITSPPSQIWYS